MLVHLICNNESTVCVVIGSEAHAMKVMADLKVARDEKTRKHYGQTLSKEYIEMDYWHIHTQIPISVEGKFPDEEKWAGIIKMVNEQAEDEALWSSPVFKVQPIAEAQLQAALRALHAAIEG